MSNKQPRKIKILIIGPKYAGKTCIVHRLRYGEFLARTTQTIGVSEKEVGEEIRIIEIGGQPKFEGLMEQLNLRAGATLIFYVIDSSEEKDLQRYQQFVQKFPEEERVVVLVNKIDKIAGLRPGQVPDQLQQLKHRMVLCSAKTGENFMMIREVIMDARSSEPKRKEVEQVTPVYSQAEKEEARKEAEAILKKYRRDKTGEN